MRNYMDKLIVKGHSVPKDRSNGKRFTERDWEDAPERARMKDRDWWNSGPRDHLNPLVNFLDSRVGQPWSKVYSEICEVTDHRSFEGRHLREHIDDMVISETELKAINSQRYRRHYWKFYYDDQDILRKWNGDSSWYAAYRRNHEPNADQCVKNGEPYLRVNGCWFSAKYVESTIHREEYDWMLRKTVQRAHATTLIVAKQQLGKKELKALGLSNQPGWKWYE